MDKETKITYEDLTSIYNINVEIRKIQEEIRNLQERNFYKSNIISDMPRGGEGKDMLAEYAEKQKTLEDMLSYSLRKLQDKRLESEEFISSIEDNEDRLIVRLRCVNNMDWHEIGIELGMSRTTVSRKFRTFLEREGIIKSVTRKSYKKNTQNNKFAHNAHDNVL